MSLSKVTTIDGTVIVSTDDATAGPPGPPALHRGMLHLGPDGAYVHSGRPLDPGSFFAGLMLGALLYFILQSAMRWHARSEARGSARAAAIGPQREDRTAADIAALARRTAALETIVTDPAHRTAREIDALR